MEPRIESTRYILYNHPICRYPHNVYEYNEYYHYIIYSRAYTDYLPVLRLLCITIKVSKKVQVVVVST